jgi:hypothetical protein
MCPGGPAFSDGPVRHRRVLLTAPEAVVLLARNALGVRRFSNEPMQRLSEGIYRRTELERRTRLLTRPCELAECEP